MLQCLRDVDGVYDRFARYLEQNITGANACVVTWTAWAHVQRHYLVLTIGPGSVYPCNPIIRKMIQILLMEIDGGAARRGHCEYKQ